jgi:IclR family KDG regulon transcriptional repressor
VGLHMPVHATAAGKVLVAFESEEELRRRFNNSLPGYTKNTLTSSEQLLRKLEEVRQRGYATDLEEWEEGLHCIAAPIRDYTRKVIGALSVSGPAHRLAAEKIEATVVPEVVGAAQELSRRLGYRE